MVVDSLKYMDNITESWLPNDIDSIEGPHNGNNYLAYTFFVKNISGDNMNVDVRNYIIDVLYKVPSIDSLVKPNADGEVYFKSLDSVSEIINSGVDKFHEFNYFLGLNISDTPWNIMLSSFGVQNYLLVLVALALPIGYYFVQKYSLKLTSTTTNKKDEQNDMMAQQMKMMNKTMPLMMVFMCFISPVGLGIYWFASSAYRILQQVILNKYFDNIDVQKIIKKNEAKNNLLGLFPNLLQLKTKVKIPLKKQKEA